MTGNVTSCLCHLVTASSHNWHVRTFFASFHDWAYNDILLLLITGCNMAFDFFSWLGAPWLLVSTHDWAHHGILLLLMTVCVIAFCLCLWLGASGQFIFAHYWDRHGMLLLSWHKFPTASSGSVCKYGIIFPGCLFWLRRPLQHYFCHTWRHVCLFIWRMVPTDWPTCLRLYGIYFHRLYWFTKMSSIFGVHNSA